MRNGFCTCYHHEELSHQPRQGSGPENLLKKAVGPWKARGHVDSPSLGRQSGAASWLIHVMIFPSLWRAALAKDGSTTCTDFGERKIPPPPKLCRAKFSKFFRHDHIAGRERKIKFPSHRQIDLTLVL
jgi:hypothetical protein